MNKKCYNMHKSVAFKVFSYIIIYKLIDNLNNVYLLSKIRKVNRHVIKVKSSVVKLFSVLVFVFPEFPKYKII